MLSKNSRLVVTALGISLLLFISIYLTAVWLSGTWYPIWQPELTAINGLFLGILLAGFRPALRQLPLLGLLFSAILVRPLANLETMPFGFLTYFGFCSGIWGLSLLLTPLARFAKCQRMYFGISSLLLSTPALLIWLYYFTSGTFPTPEILLAIMQTNPSEALGYVSGHVTVSAAAALLFYLGLLYFLSRPAPAPLWRTPWAWFLAVPLAYPLINCSTQNPIVELPEKAAAYAENFAKFQKNQPDRSRLLASLHLDSREKGLFVLVIGESANSEHMGAYGYHRGTTPWLSSEMENPHFFIFRDAYSCHVQTVPSLAYALTAQNQYNHISLAEAPSLLEAAKAAGFTTAWVSNQVRYSAWDTPTTTIASQADQQIWLNSSAGLSTDVDHQDGALADALDRLTYGEKTLVILHLMGSHKPYSAHYPREYAVYAEAKGEIDDYDNTIRYNDAVMEKLYDKLQGRKDFQAMVYLSDHSEGVDYGHDHNPTTYVPAMTYIPFYLAFSDDYLAAHEAIAGNLRNHEYSTFTNDLLFNAMTSLLGIHIEGMDEPENDITRISYDGNPERFLTLYGAKAITPRRIGNENFLQQPSPSNAIMEERR